MKRLFDIIVSFFFILLLAPLFVCLAILIKFSSKGPVIFWSKRVGRLNKNFMMPKLRTMYTDTPVVATHLLSSSSSHITPIGTFLRKTSLDELPQLWSILIGSMSFVGPRPALYNQNDLMELRTTKNIHSLVPGLTGWAQVNGRDEISIEKKVELDSYYLNNHSLFFDLIICCKTILKVLSSKGISH